MVQQMVSELKNAIIDTTVVSGHGSNDSANFTTTDKLYLLSSVEVWGTPYYDTVTAESPALTRQLDYYEDLGVTQSANKDKAIKKYNNSNSYWWLRSASSLDSDYFSSVGTSGSTYNFNAIYTHGVAPAFRIG